MKRPIFSFRPNMKDCNHRKAWEILENVPEGEKNQYLVDALLFYSQTDVLKEVIRESVREGLKSANLTQSVASKEEQEVPEQMLDFVSMLQDE